MSDMRKSSLKVLEFYTSWTAVTLSSSGSSRVHRKVETSVPVTVAAKY